MPANYQHGLNSIDNNTANSHYVINTIRYIDGAVNNNLMFDSPCQSSPLPLVVTQDGDDNDDDDVDPNDRLPIVQIVSTSPQQQRQSKQPSPQQQIQQPQPLQPQPLQQLLVNNAYIRANDSGDDDDDDDDDDDQKDDDILQVQVTYMANALSRVNSKSTKYEFQSNNGGDDVLSLQSFQSQQKQLRRQQQEQQRQLPLNGASDDGGRDSFNQMISGSNGVPTTHFSSHFAAAPTINTTPTKAILNTVQPPTPIQTATLGAVQIDLNPSLPKPLQQQDQYTFNHVVPISFPRDNSSVLIKTESNIPSLSYNIHIESDTQSQCSNSYPFQQQQHQPQHQQQQQAQQQQFGIDDKMVGQYPAKVDQIKHITIHHGESITTPPIKPSYPTDHCDDDDQLGELVTVPSTIGHHNQINRCHQLSPQQHKQQPSPSPSVGSIYRQDSVQELTTFDGYTNYSNVQQLQRLQHSTAQYYRNNNSHGDYHSNYNDDDDDDDDDDWCLVDREPTMKCVEPDEINNLFNSSPSQGKKNPHLIAQQQRMFEYMNTIIVNRIINDESQQDTTLAIASAAEVRNCMVDFLQQQCVDGGRQSYHDHDVDLELDEKNDQNDEKLAKLTFRQYSSSFLSKPQPLHKQSTNTADQTTPLVTKEHPTDSTMTDATPTNETNTNTDNCDKALKAFPTTSLSRLYLPLWMSFIAYFTIFAACDTVSSLSTSIFKSNGLLSSAMTYIIVIFTAFLGPILVSHFKPLLLVGVLSLSYTIYIACNFSASSVIAGGFILGLGGMMGFSNTMFLLANANYMAEQDMLADIRHNGPPKGDNIATTSRNRGDSDMVHDGDDTNNSNSATTTADNAIAPVAAVESTQEHSQHQQHPQQHHGGDLYHETSTTLHPQQNKITSQAVMMNQSELYIQQIVDKNGRVIRAKLSNEEQKRLKFSIDSIIGFSTSWLQIATNLGSILGSVVGFCVLYFLKKPDEILTVKSSIVRTLFIAFLCLAVVGNVLFMVALCLLSKDVFLIAGKYSQFDIQQRQLQRQHDLTQQGVTKLVYYDEDGNVVESHMNCDDHIDEFDDDQPPKLSITKYLKVTFKCAYYVLKTKVILLSLFSIFTCFSVIGFVTGTFVSRSGMLDFIGIEFITLFSAMVSICSCLAAIILSRILINTPQRARIYFTLGIVLQIITILVVWFVPPSKWTSKGFAWGICVVLAFLSGFSSCITGCALSSWISFMAYLPQLRSPTFALINIVKSLGLFVTFMIAVYLPFKTQIYILFGAFIVSLCLQIANLCTQWTIPAEEIQERLNVYQQYLDEEAKSKQIDEMLKKEEKEQKKRKKQADKQKQQQQRQDGDANQPTPGEPHVKQLQHHIEMPAVYQQRNHHNLHGDDSTSRCHPIPWEGRGDSPSRFHETEMPPYRNQTTNLVENNTSSQPNDNTTPHQHEHHQPHPQRHHSRQFSSDFCNSQHTQYNSPQRHQNQSKNNDGSMNLQFPTSSSLVGPEYQHHHDTTNFNSQLSSSTTQLSTNDHNHVKSHIWEDYYHHYQHTQRNGDNDEHHSVDHQQPTCNDAPDHDIEQQQQHLHNQYTINNHTTDTGSVHSTLAKPQHNHTHAHNEQKPLPPMAQPHSAAAPNGFAFTAYTQGAVCFDDTTSMYSYKSNKSNKSKKSHLSHKPHHNDGQHPTTNANDATINFDNHSRRHQSQPPHQQYQLYDDTNSNNTMSTLGSMRSNHSSHHHFNYGKPTYKPSTPLQSHESPQLGKSTKPTLQPSPFQRQRDGHYFASVNDQHNSSPLVKSTSSLGYYNNKPSPFQDRNDHHDGHQHQHTDTPQIGLGPVPEIVPLPSTHFNNKPPQPK